MRKITTATVALVLALTVSASADDYTWTGDLNELWTRAENWDNAQMNGGTPNIPGDTATIPVTARIAHVNATVTVGSVTIEDNAVAIIDGGRKLTITSTDGLSIGDEGDLFIEGGTLALTGGGELRIVGGGAITFQDADGTISFDGDRPYYIARGPAPDPEGSRPRVVIGVTEGQTFTGTLITKSGSDITFVLQRNNAMAGVLTISVPMINNGWVVADRAGDITLDCHPKSGDGQWRIINSGAKIVANVPVTGGECGGVFISAGVLEVNEHWITCGDLEMEQDGGKIAVAAKTLFKAGTCAQACECIPIG